MFNITFSVFTYLLSWLLVLHDIDQVYRDVWVCLFHCLTLILYGQALPGYLGRRPSLLPSPACSSPPCWPASLEQIQSLQKSVAMNLY